MLVFRKLLRTYLMDDPVPEICCLMLPLNSKKLLFKTNSAMFKRSSVGIFFSCLSAFNPTSCGILGHNPTTSAVN